VWASREEKPFFLPPQEETNGFSSDVRPNDGPERVDKGKKKLWRVGISSWVGVQRASDSWP